MLQRIAPSGRLRQRKLKKVMAARLSRLPPVGSANDLETGDFEIDTSEIAACDRLEASHPHAQIWMVRIGSRHVRRFGGRTKSSTSSSPLFSSNSRGKRVDLDWIVAPN
jgi:hypothetical protein